MTLVGKIERVPPNATASGPLFDMSQIESHTGVQLKQQTQLIKKASVA